jgi:hypothetical protein
MSWISASSQTPAAISNPDHGCIIKVSIFFIHPFFPSSLLPHRFFLSIGYAMTPSQTLTINNCL